MLRFAKLTVDENEYTLAWDFNAIVDVEEQCGDRLNLLAAIENLNSINAAQLRGLLLAAMEAGPEKAFPGLDFKASLQAAGDLIRLDTVTAITLTLAEAYRLSLPSEPTIPEPKPDEESNGEVQNSSAA